MDHSLTATEVSRVPQLTLYPAPTNHRGGRNCTNSLSVRLIRPADIVQQHDAAGPSGRDLINRFTGLRRDGRGERIFGAVMFGLLDASYVR